VPDWDEDSPRLRKNLAQLSVEIVRAASRRETPTLETAKRWQTLSIEGLDVPDSRYVGAFRGEPGLENVHVRVGSTFGVEPARVAEELTRFEAKLDLLINALDALLPIGEEPDADQLAAIVDSCAWAHAEWVRIHPFANGNGRTARLWANSIAIRYGLPFFVRLRPRPGAGYGEACGEAMQGNWIPTAELFLRMLDDILSKDSPQSS
jgi:hypothetical protein